MIKSLEQYFIQMGFLDLPGIGSIRLSKQEAEWQDSILHAPQETIIFDPIGNKPAKSFYIFIADLMGISSDQAAVKLDQLIKEFKETTVSTLELGSLGVLQKQADHYKWTSYYNGVDYYQNLSISTSENNTLFEDIENKNEFKWAVGAIVLLIIALALIFYKQL